MAKNTIVSILTFKELIHDPANGGLPNVLIDDFKVFLNNIGIINSAYSGPYITGFQNAISTGIKNYLLKYGPDFEKDIEQEFVYNVLSSNKDSFFQCSIILEFWDEIITSLISSPLTSLSPKTVINYRSGFRKFMAYILANKIISGKCVNLSQNPQNATKAINIQKYKGVKPKKSIISILKKEIKTITYDAETIKYIFKSRLRTQRRNGLPLDDIATILKGHTINGKKADLSALLDIIVLLIIFYYYDDNNNIQIGKIGDIDSIIFDLKKKVILVVIKNKGTFKLATEVFNPDTDTQKNNRVMSGRSISDIHIDHIFPVDKIKRIFIIILIIIQGIKDHNGDVKSYIDSLTEEELKKLQDGLFYEVLMTFLNIELILRTIPIIMQGINAHNGNVMSRIDNLTEEELKKLLDELHDKVRMIFLSGEFILNGEFIINLQLMEAKENLKKSNK